MGIREVLRRCETAVGAVHDLRKVVKIPLLRVVRGRKIKAYLRAHRVRKLEIGAGSDSMDGWLNTDIAPQSARTVYMDATARFPFDDGTFDYVHSEHVLEHLSWQEGLFMLRECRRVLKSGGTARIATPDLEFLIGLYARRDDPSNARFIEWVMATFLPEIPVHRASFVINTYLGSYWGHRLVYDGELLAMAMREAGFADVRRCVAGESAHANLKGVELHRKKCGDSEFAILESVVFEGTCPA